MLQVQSPVAIVSTLHLTSQHRNRSYGSEERVVSELRVQRASILAIACGELLHKLRFRVIGVHELDMHVTKTLGNRVLH